MYPEVVFKMPEERFKGIGILGDIRTANELEHVGDCPFQVDVCFPYFVVCIGHLAGLHVDGFLPDELPVFFMPLVVNGNEKCTDFGNWECTDFGNNNAPISVTTIHNFR